MNIRKYVKDDGLAEDILQDVFVALWTNRAKLAEDGVVGWLFVVSCRKAISFLRKHIQENLTLSFDTEAIPELYTDEADELDVQLNSLQWSILEEAIALLPEKRRAVFRLCKLEGYSYKDAASQLGISVESVKEYLKKSTKSVKSYIEENYRPEVLTQGFIFVILLSV